MKKSTKKLSAKYANAKKSHWTFLTNHTHVLIVLANKPDSVLRHVAMQIGITERAVQRIVAELEEEGYLRREKLGRQNYYHPNLKKALRHTQEKHCTIGDVIALINDKR